MTIKYRRQRPIKGGRQSLPACVIKDISHEVEKLARQHRVSKSFVIAVALAEQFGISEQESYMQSYMPQPLRLQKKRA